MLPLLSGEIGAADANGVPEFVTFSDVGSRTARDNNNDDSFQERISVALPVVGLVFREAVHFVRQGYGRLLIDFSYHLSKLIKLPGTPERPSSYEGVCAYIRYWTDAICAFLEGSPGEFSAQRIEESTGVLVKDIIQTMELLNMIKKKDGIVFVVESKLYVDHLQKRRRAIEQGRYRRIEEKCVVTICFL
uniref:Histone acetyltransferase n=1 Tax=Trichuris muris TaxID=70415 RepID=A0A5S6Q7T6_TRIMR